MANLIAQYTSTMKAERPRSEEWIPLLLRPRSLLLLAALSFGMIAALEVLHHLTVTRVLSSQDKTTLNLLRYMPTLCMIITPWANMSGKWATGSNSVLLNYVNDLEIVAVFKALKRKHWAVSVALIGTFLCGALVPLANSLLYVDLFATRDEPIMVNQTSVFDFDDSPLAFSNGSLKIPYNVTGIHPYARAIPEQLNNRPQPLWATGNYAFDQFTFQSRANATVTAEVNAVSATLSCQRLRYRYQSHFTANSNDLQAAGCSQASGIDVPSYLLDRLPFAWLNITQCSAQENDVRILALYLYTDIEPQRYDYTFDDSSLRALICSPHFTSQRVSLSVNSTNSRITAFSAISEPQPLDIRTATEALWVYLQNPLESEVQRLFRSGQDFANSNPTARPIANIGNITRAVAYLGPSTPQSDSFMQIILNGQLGGDPRDFGIFEKSVTDFAANLIRTIVLRAAEALLATVGGLTLTLALGLRPKTVLGQDPGPLAAASIVLSGSDPNTEAEMAKYATSSDKSISANFRNARLTFKQKEGNCGVELDCAKDPDLSKIAETEEISNGWRPFPLHLCCKIALQVAIGAAIIFLGIMLWLSSELDGLCVDTPVSSTAFILVTSTLLVVLGYCCAGVDAAAQALAPFNIMRKTHNRDSILTDDLSFLGRFAGSGSIRINIALVASAAYVLLIPATKLVAAGLYTPTNTQIVEQVVIQVNTSLPIHLEHTFNTSISVAEPFIKRACNFAEWESMPNVGIRSRTGIVGNLVLSELKTVVGKVTTPDGTIKARVPAIAVDVRCKPISDFNLSVTIATDGNHTFSWHCVSERCNQAIKPAPASVPSLTTSNYSRIPSYSGRVGKGYQGDADAGYWMYIGDYSSLGGSYDSFKNLTPLSRWAKPGLFNVTLPTMRAASCNRNLSLVHVNTTFTRPSQATISGGTELLPWRPVSVDDESISYERPYQEVQPIYFHPPDIIESRDLSSLDADGKLNGDSLWPSRGSSQIFFELLAADAEYRVGSLSRLPDPVGLGDSAEHMYTAYPTQLLSELRPVANEVDTAGNAVYTVTATLTYHQPRIHQDATTTYILEALLFTIACFIGLVFYHFPSKAIVPKAPGSIAARFSLLAHSSLVRRMREEQVRDLEVVRGWKMPAALGWWQQHEQEAAEQDIALSRSPSPSSTLQAAGSTSSKWRWGVDAGQEVTFQDWSHPPHLPLQISSSTLILPEWLAMRAVRRTSVSSSETLVGTDQEY
ncbi:hypothetical protein BJY04DRAFT_231893 [Aspergillus karnatakaensis]|uniref:DUF3433 domain-containing protein n=1 Tax=Aspergillus karnatakaensis TaxID=1810916 RepID=UPI003CCCCD4E